MDPFYSTVCIVAFVILIIVLVILGIFISYPSSSSTNTTPFPPTANTCPDYWTASEDNALCYVPARYKNTGSIYGSDGTVIKSNTVFSNSETSNKSDTAVDAANNYYVKSYNPTNPSNLCDLNTWTTNNNVSWNGVSNTNQC